MHNVFQTSIYQKKINFDLPDLKNEIFQIKKADHEGLLWSKNHYPNGYTSYGSWDRLHMMSSTFDSLRRKIDRHVQSYLKSLHYDANMNEISMDTCWVNIMPTNTIHTSHIHPQCVISGTFYVQANSRSSAIKFEDPRLGFFMNSPQISAHAPKTHQRFFSVQPKAGDLVLFESWLRHEVPMNTDKTDRISISFNYSWNSSR